MLLPKYGGTEVKLGDKKLQLVREEDLLGVIEKLELGVDRRCRSTMEVKIPLYTYA